ncbi:carbohydrate ABC transporter permease [Methylocapsa sp. S129]|uniref:carbohydrate ABC transporter permease n=1 Tax=Methylocapsa sp. S129 TaxID=1641869 RepID=UPI001FF06FDA|nr:sugar ABC transporter permease [Methylocapsa sp. S129]
MATTLASSVETSRRPGGRGWLTILIFLPPALLLFTIFVAMPMGEAAWYSFYNWNGYGRPENFIGLKNYASLIGNHAFTQALLNNFLIIAVSLAIQLPLALGVALIVSKKIRGAVAFRMIFFLPYILADVAAGLIWRFVYDGDYGLVSGMTSLIGAQPVFLLADKNWAFSAVLVVIVWKYFGFHMMLYVAGLQSLDKALLEAAEIDGANAVQRFRHITLPLLGPMIRLSIFFSVVGALQLFDMIVPLTGGGPFDTTNTMVSYLYFFGITRMRVGFGSAVGVVLFLFCVTFALGYRRFFMRDD